MKIMNKAAKYGTTWCDGMNLARVMARARGMRVFAAASEPTLYQLKEDMATLQAAMKADERKIVDMSADPSANFEEIEKVEQHMDELEKRYNLLKRAHDNKEARERKAMQLPPAQPGDPTSPAVKNEARGKLVFSALNGGNLREVVSEYKDALGAIPEGGSGGEKLLPTTMQTELLHEAFEHNPLLSQITVTNITGLERPRIAYSLDDDSDVSDNADGKELSIDPDDLVHFERHKSKIKVLVSDTVMHGTATDLGAYVTGAIESGVAAKDLRRMFATSPKSGEAHMSFYATGEGNANLKTIAGSSMIMGIIAALGDLKDEYGMNARVVMRRADYYAEIMTMANGASTLWGVKPEDVIGCPVIFCDRAVKPIVGDLRYVQKNYDIASTYDTDKDADKGMYKFIQTNWDDIQIVLPEALRIVDATSSAALIREVRSVAKLPTTGQKQAVVYVLSAADGDRTAGTMWTWSGTAWTAYGA